MRWLLPVIAVATGVWYVSNRQRRDRVRHSVREAVPPGAAERVQRAAATVAAATRQTASAIQTRVAGPTVHAPSVPDSDNGPTTGMEQPPVRDHTDALHRTSGAYMSLSEINGAVSGSSSVLMKQNARWAWGHASRRDQPPDEALPPDEVLPPAASSSEVDVR
jgi:hypothetical protein